MLSSAKQRPLDAVIRRSTLFTPGRMPWLAGVHEPSDQFLILRLEPTVQFELVSCSGLLKYDAAGRQECQRLAPGIIPMIGMDGVGLITEQPQAEEATMCGARQPPVVRGKLRHQKRVCRLLWPAIVGRRIPVGRQSIVEDEPTRLLLIFAGQACEACFDLVPIAALRFVVTLREHRLQEVVSASESSEISLVRALSDDGGAQEEIKKRAEERRTTCHPAGCAQSENGLVEGDCIGTEAVQRSPGQGVRMDAIKATGNRFVDRDRELNPVTV